MSTILENTNTKNEVRKKRRFSSSSGSVVSGLAHADRGVAKSRRCARVRKVRAQGASESFAGTLKLLKSSVFQENGSSCASLTLAHHRAVNLFCHNVIIFRAPSLSS